MILHLSFFICCFSNFKAVAAASVSASSSSSGGGAAAPAPTADEPADEEPIDVPFMPNSLREAFRVNVSSTVTALLLISEATLLVVGTEGGAVYFNSTLAEGDMMAVDMSRVGDRSPVAGLHHGVYLVCFVIHCFGLINPTGH